MTVRRLLWLVVATAYAVGDIWLLSLLAQAIGVPSLILLLIVELAFGLYLVRRAGGAALRSLGDTLATGSGDSGGAAASSGLVAVAGVLIAFPGVLTDALGLLLLIPGVRRWTAGVIGRSLRRRYERYVTLNGTGTTLRGTDTIIVTSVVRDEDEPKGPTGQITP